MCCLSSYYRTGWPCPWFHKTCLISKFWQRHQDTIRLKLIEATQRLTESRCYKWTLDSATGDIDESSH